MVNFMYQLGKGILAEINIYIGKLQESDCIP